MAIIKNNETAEIVCLNTQHTFGRNQNTAHTYIPEKDISQSHALISWRGSNWYIQDHSRNGTIVNGEYINNTAIKLAQGFKIQFGENTSTLWVIVNLDPPSSYLKSLKNKNKIIELTTGHAFPNEEEPEVLIYPEDAAWKLEKNGVIDNLVQNRIYVFDNEEYVFVENQVLEDTMDNGHIVNNAYFQFVLSSDEEHIRIKIITQNLELDLGERVHNYILLALARKRLMDVENGYVFGDQGWMAIDDLLNDMSKEFGKELDAYYLNLKIYRIRKLLLETKPYGYLFANSVERRYGEIRFAHRFFQILKEERCIGEVLAIAN
ncbi:FHA domain-containing protein [Aquimarina latercula]|uniref:FHA domain-containing protein n=1 Tax=Aquimarina latercula TaxID=987 RepID=UPI000427790D|nr:FHA domain-containing protein [Aquimarina latercula]